MVFAAVGYCQAFSFSSIPSPLSAADVDYFQLAHSNFYQEWTGYAMELAQGSRQSLLWESLELMLGSLEVDRFLSVANHFSLLLIELVEPAQLVKHCRMG